MTKLVDAFHTTKTDGMGDRPVRQPLHRGEPSWPPLDRARPWPGYHLLVSIPVRPDIVTDLPPK
jgi:hypothetical protein